MNNLRSTLSSVLIGLVAFAVFGFGVLALGFAIILGGMLAIAFRLAGSGSLGERGRFDARSDRRGFRRPSVGDAAPT